MVNRMRTLCLDDDPERHAWVKDLRRRDEVVCVFRYSEVISALERERWDLLFLDHDLADKVADADYMGAVMYASDGGCRYYNGRDVAAWLVANPGRCPPAIWIHSWSDHAEAMESILAPLKAAGVLVHLKRKQAPV